MTIQFFDRQDSQNPLNGKAIRAAGEVTRILNFLTNRSPFFCELVAENGYRLLIGVGPTACVEYARNDGSPPNLMAVAGSSRGGPAPVKHTEFLIGDTLTPVSGRYALPLAVAADIGEYFQKTGERMPTVGWEEI